MYIYIYIDSCTNSMLLQISDIYSRWTQSTTIKFWWGFGVAMGCIQYIQWTGAESFTYLWHMAILLYSYIGNRMEI